MFQLKTRKKKEKEKQNATRNFGPKAMSIRHNIHLFRRCIVCAVLYVAIQQRINFGFFPQWMLRGAKHRPNKHNGMSDFFSLLFNTPRHTAHSSISTGRLLCGYCCCFCCMNSFWLKHYRKWASILQANAIFFYFVSLFFTLLGRICGVENAIRNHNKEEEKWYLNAVHLRK